MVRAFISKVLLVTGLALLATPGAAQMFSDGFEFLKAVRELDGQAVTDALNQPGSTIVNTRDRSSGETALHIVTAKRETTWISFLLQRGANPNIADKDGITPLMIASNLGYVEGVEALVKGGARVDVSNVAGETPLISAIHRRDIAMLRLLLDNGANPDRSDNSGRTARDYAAVMTGNTTILEALAEHDNKVEAAGQAAQTYGPEIR